MFVLAINSLAYAEPQIQPKQSAPEVKNKNYQEYKKQLIIESKIYDEQKRKKGTFSDQNDIPSAEGEFVDFSTGQPIKIK